MKFSIRSVRIGVITALTAVAFTIIVTTTQTLSQAQLAMSPWPMFHHDARHTGLSTVDTCANPGEQKWALKLHIGVDVTSPVVGVDGTIYVASHDRHLYALNP